MPKVEDLEYGYFMTFWQYMVATIYYKLKESFEKVWKRMPRVIELVYAFTYIGSGALAIFIWGFRNGFTSVSPAVSMQWSRNCAIIFLVCVVIHVSNYLKHGYDEYTKTMTKFASKELKETKSAIRSLKGSDPTDPHIIKYIQAWAKRKEERDATWKE